MSTVTDQLNASRAALSATGRSRTTHVPLGGGLQSYETAVVVSDGLTDAEAETRSFTLLLGTEERLEHLVANVLGDAGPVIFHRQCNSVVQSSRPASQCISTVLHQVDDDLLQLSRLSTDERQSTPKLINDFDLISLELTPNQFY